jgi:hypothetical protein
VGFAMVFATWRSSTTEGVMLRRLADLRESALDRVRTAEQDADVTALRAAFAQTFTGIYVDLNGRLTVQPRAPRASLPLDVRET